MCVVMLDCDEREPGGLRKPCRKIVGMEVRYNTDGGHGEHREHVSHPPVKCIQRLLSLEVSDVLADEDILTFRDRDRVFLMGADGEVYAVAQGPVVGGGFQATGAGQAVRGDGQTGVGVVGTATSTAGYGGYFINTAAGGFALWADGPMQCKTLKILGGADLAEPFNRIREAIDLLYGQFVKFDFRNGELRRKYDAIKYNLQKVERILYDLTFDGRCAGESETV